MKGFLVSILFFFSIVNVFGQHYNEKYGQPIVVLIETNPWLMVVGSDVPSFALYENGQIIYRKVVNKKYEYFEVKKDSQSLQNIIKSLGLSDSLMKQANYTKATNWTDQPTNLLLLNFDSVHQIEVYGDLMSPNNEARNNTPKPFLKVYDRIKGFEDPSAVQWLPDTIEIMATKYSYSPEVPLKWNSLWADLKSPNTIKRGDNLYSLYIDKKYFEDFLKLLRSMKEKQAVEINGEKFSLSYRLPFPNLR